MQRAGLYAGDGVVGQARQVGGRVGQLQVAETRLFLQQLLRLAHIAVEEHAHRQAQVVQQVVQQLADLLRAGLGELAALLDLLVLNVQQHALDDVADLLHVDGEADDFRPALRSEEHTSELQSQSNLVCRLLLEKKKNTTSAYRVT